MKNENEESPEIIHVGRTVVCDLCNADYTDSPESGGFQFGSYAVCPKCAPGMMKEVMSTGEQSRITATCPEGMSYADWVRDILRGGEPGTIEIHSF